MKGHRKETQQGVLVFCTAEPCDILIKNCVLTFLNTVKNMVHADTNSMSGNGLTRFFLHKRGGISFYNPCQNYVANILDHLSELTESTV